MVEIGGFYVPTWLCLLVPTVALLHRYLTSNYDYFTKQGIPGPKPYPLIGTIYGLIKRGSHENDVLNRKKYGKLIGGFQGTRPRLLVYDLDILKAILIKEFPHFQNHYMVPLSEYPMRKILTSLRFDHWKHVRNALTPTFSGAKLRKMTALVNKSAKTLVYHLEKKADTNTNVEIRSEVEQFTMDTIASTAFGLDVDTKANPDNDFVKFGRQFAVVFNIRVLLMLIFPKLMKMLGITLFSQECIAFFTQAIDHSLQTVNESDEQNFIKLLSDEDRGEPADGEETTNPSLVKSEDGHVYNKTGLTREELLASALTFFVAGFDTTASGLSFLIYNLACHPEEQEKVYQEITTVLGDEEDPDYDSMKKMPYLHMCIEESLRLYPPVVRTDRVCGEDTVIRGVRIEKGTPIDISPWGMHRDSELWPNPEAFIPERFTEEEKSKRNPLAWIPFGHGPRNCIGMRLALMEMKFAVIHLLMKFRLVTCEQTEIPIKLKSLTMRASNGMYIRVEHR